jgi:WD40 repeat protein
VSILKFFEEALTATTTNSIQFLKSVMTTQTRGINCVLLVSNDCIATGSRDKTIAITSLAGSSGSGMLLSGHQDQVTALSLFSDQMLVSGAGNLDPTLIVWSLKTGK